MPAKKYVYKQTKSAFPESFSMVRFIWLGIIVIALTVTGCAGPDSSSEPESETAPAETEEIEESEPAEIEAEVAVSEGSTLAIRKSAGTQDKPEDDVLDRVPRGRVLKIVNKHEDSLVEDGYTWWEVEDTETGISGWSAAEYLEEKN